MTRETIVDVKKAIVYTEVPIGLALPLDKKVMFD